MGFFARRHGRFLWLTVCLLALPHLVAATDPTADEIAARVGDTVITRRAVRAVVEALAAAQETPPNGKQVEQLTRDALDSLIAFELLYQESQRRGVTVSDADVDEDIARTKARFASTEVYTQALAQRGLSLDEVRRDTRKTLAVNRVLVQTVWSDIQIPPERGRRFYDANREQFKRAEEIRASHILIRAGKDAPASERTRAKQQAEALLAQIHGGADFADLARQHSQDPATAPKGGDLGFFSRGAMEPTFEQAAFALKPGTLSGVVSTPYGFHIIKVTDHRPAGYASFADVQDSITAMLRDDEKRQRQDQLVATLKQQAKVEILPGLKPAPARKSAPAAD